MVAGLIIKTWINFYLYQDGLRALLPNVNVSFGQSGHGGLGNGGLGNGLGNGGMTNTSVPNTGHSGLGHNFGLQNNYQSSFAQERQQMQQQQQQQHNSSKYTMTVIIKTNFVTVSRLGQFSLQWSWQ